MTSTLMSSAIATGTAATAHTRTIAPITVLTSVRGRLRASIGVTPRNTMTGPSMSARNDAFTMPIPVSAIPNPAATIPM